jgi:glycosyltransferase involved in cell wall biosynthesis
VNAEAVKQWLLADGYDASKIVIIPNGVDLGRFNGVDRAAARRSLGVSDSTKLVGVVSRLSRLKGIEDFLLAASMVASRMDDVKFVIVGEQRPDQRHRLYSMSCRSWRERSRSPTKSCLPDCDRTFLP